LKPVLLGILLLTGACAATNTDCEQILQHALHSKNPDTRKQAAIALSLAVARGPLLADLEQTLHDKDVQVRIAGVNSLVEVKNERARKGLREALADPVPEVSFAAAKALWALRDKAGEEALRSILEGESKASSGLITRQKRDAVRMLHTPHTLLLYVLVNGIGFAPVPGLGEGIASMQALILDPKISGRANAALLLGNDKDPATLDALLDSLKDKDWSVRAAAAHSVALRNNRSLLKALEPLLADKKEAVRLRAAAGFLRLSTFSGPDRKK
jgi:HEAT repeat protein